MNASRIALAALILLSAARPVGGAGEIAVLFPPDLALVTDESVAVYAYQAGGGVPTHVKVNGKVAARLEGELFRKGEVALTPGTNVLDIGGTVVRVLSVKGSKLERAELPGDGGAVVTYQAQRLHPALDEGCEACHQVEGGKLGAKDQKEACGACHADFGAEEEGKKKYLHAPVAAGECTGCHDPHFSTRPKLQKLEKGCYECHDAFPREGSIHRPVADGECMACHSPHVSLAPRQLLRPGNDLCRGCHEKPHVQHLSSEVKGRMTEVPEDFPKEGGALSCLGCHQPHQSAERRLFRKPQGELCRTCHRV